MTQGSGTEDTGGVTDASIRTLFESMDDGLCILEIVPDESGRVTDVRYVAANPAFAAHTGEPNVEGRFASEVFPGLEAHWFAHFSDVGRSGEPARFVDRSDAFERWFEVSLNRIGELEERRVACSFKDVTRAHQTQNRALEMAAELSEVDRRKTEFLAMLAHELRNPLAPISSGLELMDRLAEGSSELVQTRRMMARQVGQMTRLVDDLLDLSRISQDKIELQRRPVALVEILDGAVDACRPMLEQRGHALAIQRPSDDVVVEVDAVRLTQVLANLLNNAVRYTPRGGHVQVSASVEADVLRLSVVDDGEGIDAQGLERIFEMFTQVRGNTPREHGGLGIGLTLSRRLVELHGGELDVYSEGLGRGSRFEVSVPIDAAVTPERAADVIASDTPATRPLRILVVDDNRDAADTLARILGLRGHDASVVYNGQDALRAVEGARPEVVFLDIGLPDITGYQVALELGAKSWRERIVLVALTGWGMAEDRRRSTDAGFEHHLTKPVSAQRVFELLAEIGSALGS